MAPVGGGPATRLTYWNSLTPVRSAGPRTAAWSSRSPVYQPFRSRSWAYALPRGRRPGRAAAVRADLRPGPSPGRRDGAADRPQPRARDVEAVPRRHAGPVLDRRRGRRRVRAVPRRPRRPAGRPGLAGRPAGVPQRPRGPRQRLLGASPTASDLRRHSDHTGQYARDLGGDLEGSSIAGRLPPLRASCSSSTHLDADAEPVRVEVELPGVRVARQPTMFALAKSLDDVENIGVDRTGRASAVNVRGTVQWVTHRDGPVRSLADTPGVRTRLPRALPDGGAVWVTDADGDDALELTAGGETRRIAGGELGRVLELVVVAGRRARRRCVARRARAGRRARRRRGARARPQRVRRRDRSGVLARLGVAGLVGRARRRAALDPAGRGRQRRGARGDPGAVRRHLARRSPWTASTSRSCPRAPSTRCTTRTTSTCPSRSACARTCYRCAADDAVAVRPVGRGTRRCAAEAGRRPSDPAPGSRADRRRRARRARGRGARAAAGLHTDLRAGKRRAALAHPPDHRRDRRRPARGRGSRPVRRCGAGTSRQRQASTIVDELDWYAVSGDGTRIVVRDGDALRVGPSDHKVEPDDRGRRAGRARDRRPRPHPGAYRPRCRVAADADRDLAADARPLLDRGHGRRRLGRRARRGTCRSSTGIATRDDLSELLWEMIGELGSSHAYERIEYPPAPTGRAAAFLGADLSARRVRDVDGRARAAPENPPFRQRVLRCVRPVRTCVRATSSSR